MVFEDVVIDCQLVFFQYYFQLFIFYRLIDVWISIFIFRCLCLALFSFSVYYIDVVCLFFFYNRIVGGLGFRSYLIYFYIVILSLDLYFSSFRGNIELFVDQLSFFYFR